ncbi:hypothetical protein HNQ50_001973 [Silvimonas terrae]|uniref:Uncharacterized protein n=1 Tax=Silvimonas terrae TaxID=300266 RepID=A0A840RFR8_9NEIS|nr:hypothetical protein [Silvimonas terrae]
MPNAIRLVLPGCSAPASRIKKLPQSANDPSGLLRQIENQPRFAGLFSGRPTRYGPLLSYILFCPLPRKPWPDAPSTRPTHAGNNSATKVSRNLLQSVTDIRTSIRIVRPALNTGRYRRPFTDRLPNRHYPFKSGEDRAENHRGRACRPVCSPGRHG